MPIVSTLLIIYSLLGDTASVASDTAGRVAIDSRPLDTAITLPQPLPDTTNGDSTAEIDSIGGAGLGASPASPDANASIAATTPPPYLPHLYLTNGGINFESTESDVIDEFDDERSPSVMLEENPKSSGLGVLIPGSVVITIGGIIFGVMLSGIDGTVSSAQMDRLSGVVVAGSFVTIGGALMVTAGIPQFKRYLRWGNRYRLPLPRRSTVSSDNGKRPTVIRQSE